MIRFVVVLLRAKKTYPQMIFIALGLKFVLLKHLRGPLFVRLQFFPDQERRWPNRNPEDEVYEF